MSELTLTMLRRSNVALATVAWIVLASCAPEIPVGRFACESDNDCPDGWTCGKNSSGSRRCYPEGSDLNAVTNPDGSVNADSGAAPDSGGSEKQGSSGTGGNPTTGSE